MNYPATSFNIITEMRMGITELVTHLRIVLDYGGRFGNIINLIIHLLYTLFALIITQSINYLNLHHIPILNLDHKYWQKDHKYWH